MDESDSSSSSTTCVSDEVASCSNSWNNLAEANDGPLYHMNSLIASLPFKRGLSSFYGGKSQSFSSLADVKSVEELAKPEDSFCKRKKLKGCGVSSASSMICKRPQKGSKIMRSKTATSFVKTSGSPVSPSKHIS